MLRKISKWGVLYIWERAINTDLDEGMEFDKLICVKKSNATDLVYSGFFTVKQKRLIKKVTFAQYVVHFRPNGGIQKRILMLWTNEGIQLLRSFSDSVLICDNRKDFPWI